MPQVSWVEELQMTLTPARVDQRNYGVMLSNWRVGQVLNALVVDTRPNSAVLLSVGGKQFVATTDIPVQPGTRLALEVKQVGEEVVLKRIQEQVTQRATASGRAAETTQTLTSARPAALMNQLAAQPARFGSPDLQEVARELLGKGVRGETLRPGDLQRAFKRSGLFTEADLASGRSNQARQSTKGSLSQLQTLALALADDADELSAESRVLRQIGERAGSVLQGIVQNQLASLPSEEGALRWVFTLPVQVNEQFHDVRMKFEREPRQVEGEEDAWRAQVTVDLPRLGEVDIHVGMVNGSVNVRFVCESSQSSNTLARSMDALALRLQQRDMSVTSLKTETVPPPASDTALEDDVGAVNIKA